MLKHVTIVSSCTSRQENSGIPMNFETISRVLSSVIFSSPEINFSRQVLRERGFYILSFVIKVFRSQFRQIIAGSCGTWWHSTTMT